MGTLEGSPLSPAAGGQTWLANPHDLVDVTDRLLPKLGVNTISPGPHEPLRDG